MTTAATDFRVRKDDLHRTEFAAAPDPASIKLAPDQILLAVDSFAMTANNITYAVFGAAMRYWDFFPAPEGWGIVPVWGFAVVARSANPALKEGERIFGYLPMSSHFVVTADHVTDAGFVEVAAHRRELPPIYNHYQRCAGDPGYDAAHEGEQMLLRVLFLTGWLIDDFLGDSDFFGARSVVLSSASSKTAIGLAWCLSKRGRERCEVVGLTSPANKAFVEGLGCYHRVVTYDAIETLSASTPSVFVDMAGDTAVTSGVHRHFGDSLRYSCSVGGTHWENLAFGQEFPGPRPTLFFAPSQAEKRMADWGPAGLQQRIGQAWKEFLPSAHGWITVERASGREAIERVYLETLDGRADARRGYVLSF